MYHMSIERRCLAAGLVDLFLFVGDRTSYTRISFLSFLGQSRRDGLIDVYNSIVVRLSVSSPSVNVQFHDVRYGR